MRVWVRVCAYVREHMRACACACACACMRAHCGGRNGGVSTAQAFDDQLLEVLTFGNAALIGAEHTQIKGHACRCAQARSPTPTETETRRPTSARGTGHVVASGTCAPCDAQVSGARLYFKPDVETHLQACRGAVECH